MSVGRSGAGHPESPLRANESRPLRPLQLRIPRLRCGRARIPGPDLLWSSRLHDAGTWRRASRNAAVSRRSHLLPSAHLQLRHRFVFVIVVVLYYSFAGLSIRHGRHVPRRIQEGWRAPMMFSFCKIFVKYLLVDRPSIIRWTSLFNTIITLYSVFIYLWLSGPLNSQKCGAGAKKSLIWHWFAQNRTTEAYIN